MSTPLLYRVWVGLSTLLLPFAARTEVRKLQRAGLNTARAHEKLGHATEPRPAKGPLIWFHGASVGESLSVLALITRMGVALPDAHFLITSGTATSARLIASRLPPRTMHQFAPLDAPGPLTRFLGHWQPDAAIFVESELWPQMLRKTYAQGTRMALVNARLSEKSRARWRSRPNFARFLLEVFDLILTQNDEMAVAMVEMNAPPERVARGVNLKSMAGALPVDQDVLFEARAALGRRPVWVASSTHEGEEETVLAVHKALLKTFPDLHLILAPRHPDRGDQVAGLIADAGLSVTRRTAGEMPGAQVYLADTMGELGTWYALTDVVFLGGSLRPIGGHNPFEVAHAGAVVLSGPHVPSFAETYAEMANAGAAIMVADGAELTSALDRLLSDDVARAKACASATAFAAQQSDTLDLIAARLIKTLALEQ